VTRVQEIASLFRCVATACATLALPWTLAANTGMYGNTEHPGIVAIAAFVLNVLVVAYLYVVEFVYLYYTSPKLGEYVCLAFDDEIQLIKNSLRSPCDETIPVHVQQRTTWEYVARDFLHKYRFDSVFLQNRFGSILQYIQSGLKDKVEANDVFQEIDEDSMIVVKDCKYYSYCL